MKLGKEAANKITEYFIPPIKLEFEKVLLFIKTLIILADLCLV